ncbi:MAG: alpha-amylase family glycosyl hydrolase [Pirellulaceae bacterium]|nr:alpha-amylase family glycosyl hydrolase [Pirellulaceae bacterium]
MRIDRKIGAWPTAEGCFFRVWAWHADRVQVLIQPGPSWKSADTSQELDLVRDDEGYWSGFMAGVKPHAIYRYRITNGDSVFERLDPAARDVVHSGLALQDPASGNGSVVLDFFGDNEVPFEPPRFKDYLIYELHVGSFAGRNDDIQTAWATFRDVENKLGYVKSLGFNCIELLPIHEFAWDRSWGYNPASFFAPESSYGTPTDFKHFVNAAHHHGLAVILDVVYNHAGPGDNVLYEFDGFKHEGGIYFEGGPMTDWGRGPAWWKREVKEFFYQNARQWLGEYEMDGLRFDVTTQINGNDLGVVIKRLREEFPDRYLIAEHLPDHPWIVKNVGFCATWHADSHHECQRALVGQSPIEKVKSFLGWDGYDESWNLVKYTLGSHDDIGDDHNGNAEKGLTDWDKSHRYLIDQLGGRSNGFARAKCRLAWALNVAMPGTPMMFMGSECHMASPHVAWGYWHDGSDANGDHRFDWSIAGDPIGMEMRRLVAAANKVRWDNPSLRSNSLEIVHEDAKNQVLAFVRSHDNNTVLTVINLSDHNFGFHGYGVSTGHRTGQWTQILCTQDAAFGGWDGAGNAFHEPFTESDGKVYINLPKWSVVMLRRI